jgi:hypothetical protein
MSIASYSELKTAIKNWLKRGTDLDSYTADFIALGEARIYRDLRIRCMETAISSTIASGVIAVPTRYRDLKFAYVNGTPVCSLERKDAEWIYYNYPTRSSDGKPRFIAREGESFIFGPYPDSDYTIKGIAYCALAALSDGNPTNWFTTNAPDLLLFASLCEVAPFLQHDDRIPLWERKYDIVRERIQREDENEEFSGSPLAATSR